MNNSRATLARPTGDGVRQPPKSPAARGSTGEKRSTPRRTAAPGARLRAAPAPLPPQDRYAAPPFPEPLAPEATDPPSMPVALRPLALVLPLAALCALAGCDAEPGFPTQSTPPTLADVQITPSRDSLATDAPTATVPLTVRADLGGEGTMRVRVLVRYEETDSLTASATLQAEPGPVQVDVPLALPRGATGDYRVEVSTEGADGRPGDQAAAVFHFDAASLGPPAIVDVSFPSTVARPASGSRSTPLVVTVTDPDGIANVAVVALTDPASGAVIGRLYDLGRANGGTDERAGDGRFSGGLQIFADTEPGTYELGIVAVDRSEATSAPATFTFTVQ